MKIEKLFYYDRYNGELRETIVKRETDKTYIVAEANYATHITKNNGRPMINGDNFFFVDRETAVAHLRDFCRYKIAELEKWQEWLRELE